MFTVKKAIITILTLLTSLVLIYSSYLYSRIGKNFIIPELQNRPIGNYAFSEENGKLKEAQFWSIQLEQLDEMNSIISTNDSLSIEDTSITIEWIGVSLLDIHSTEKIYTISGKGYNFSVQNPSNILIIDWEDTHTVLSLSSEISINITDLESKEVINTIILYPHEYLQFDPKKNKDIKWADISRVQQIFKLAYIDTRITIDWSINKSFTDKIVKLTERQKSDIISALKLLLQEQTIQKRYLYDFVDYSFISIGGQNLIEEYFFLFLNPEKKIAYYKNKILYTCANMLTSKKYNIDIQQIKNDLENLKKLKPKEYEHIIPILREHLINYIKSNTSDTNKRVAIYEFFYFLSNIESNNINPEVIDLHSSFVNYDFNDGSNLYSVVNTYTAKISQKNLARDKNGYFVYFLSKVLLGSLTELDKGDTTEIEDILGILNTYVEVSRKYYEAIDIDSITLRNKMRETGIKEYGIIIDKIAVSFRKNFFEDELNSSKLLVRNGNTGLSNTTLKLFEKNIDDIYDFYEAYNKTLRKTSLNTFLKKRFDFGRKSFDLYIEALTNYDKYISTHDKKNENFIHGWTSKKQEELDPLEAKNILSDFNWINLDSAIIESKNIGYCSNPNGNQNTGEAYCYQINNAEIAGKIFNFILTPSEGNSIKHIYLIQGLEEPKMIETELRLDSIKSRYKDGEEGKYSSFIETTFRSFGETSTGSQVLVSWNYEHIFDENDNKNIKDDPQEEILRSVKNTLLLWNSGTFTQIEDLINVEFNDISIQESDTKEQYDISLSNVDLNYEKNGSGISGSLESKYIFKAGTVSSFRSPKITIYANSGNLGFSSYTYEISGIVPIQKMKGYVEKIAIMNSSILEAVALANKYTGSGSLDIKYYVNNNLFIVNYWELTFSFNNKTKLVKSIRYKWKKYLTKLITFDKLETYFKKLP